NFGYCHINGWVVKRSVFDRTGPFEEGRSFYIGEDTVMFVKFAAVGRMMAGRLDTPVAMRRVHGPSLMSAPRSSQEVYANRILMWTTLWEWAKDRISFQRQQIILKRLIEYAELAEYFYVLPENRRPPAAERLRSISRMSALVVRYPGLINKGFLWRRFLANIFRVIVPESTADLIGRSIKKALPNL
ncbi:hypothetical protein ACFL0Q_02795, partial [Thermodesulfobacteriota bacterium]